MKEKDVFVFLSCAAFKTEQHRSCNIHLDDVCHLAGEAVHSGTAWVAEIQSKKCFYWKFNTVIRPDLLFYIYSFKMCKIGNLNQWENTI